MGGENNYKKTLYFSVCAITCMNSATAKTSYNKDELPDYQRPLLLDFKHDGALKQRRHHQREKFTFEVPANITANDRVRSYRRKKADPSKSGSKTGDMLHAILDRLFAKNLDKDPK